MSAAVEARRRLRYSTLLVVVITATGLIGLASTVLQWYAAVAFSVVALLAINQPSLLLVAVVVGQVAAGAIILGLDGPWRWMLLPWLMSLVASAELLASLARLRGPVPRVTGSAFRRSARAAAVGGAVYGAVLFVGDPPGLGGGLAAALAIGACGLLAWVVLRED